MDTTPIFRNAAANWFTGAQKGAINIHAFYTLVAWGRQKRYGAFDGLSRLLPALLPDAASLGNLLGDLCVK